MMENQKLYRTSKINMVITNLIRLILIAIFIRGCLVGDHNQDFLIALTFFMTYYPSILEKKFGVYLPNRLQIVITLFIFARAIHPNVF